jgi:hypothetical protein
MSEAVAEKLLEKKDAAAILFLPLYFDHVLLERDTIRNFIKDHLDNILDILVTYPDNVDTTDLVLYLDKCTENQEREKILQRLIDAPMSALFRIITVFRIEQSKYNNLIKQYIANEKHNPRDWIHSDVLPYFMLGLFNRLLTGKDPEQLLFIFLYKVTDYIEHKGSYEDAAIFTFNVLELVVTEENTAKFVPEKLTITAQIKNSAFPILYHKLERHIKEDKYKPQTYNLNTLYDLLLKHSDDIRRKPDVVKQKEFVHLLLGGMVSVFPELPSIIANIYRSEDSEIVL